jgi:Na+/melibiose symporter-like transporter
VVRCAKEVDHHAPTPHSKCARQQNIISPKDRAMEPYKDRRRITLAATLAYCLPVGGVAFLLLPAGVVLQNIYPRYYGLQYATIAQAMMIGQIVVAVANPFIGVLSDWHRDRGGARRTWVAAGFLGVSVSAFFLLAPLQAMTGLYFTIWSVLLTLSWAVFDVPHLAWATELVRDDGRTRLFGIRNMIVTVGCACFYALPLLPVFGSHEITPTTLRTAAVIGAGFVLPALFCAYRFVPPGARQTRTRRLRITEDVKTIFRNSPFLILITAIILISIGQGMWTTLVFIVFDNYYGVGADFSMMYLCASVATALLSPMFVRVSEKMEKRWVFAALQIAFVLLIGAQMLVQPGKHAYLPLMGILAGVLMVTIFNCAITQALLADVVDYGRWKFGHGQEASYFSLYYFLVIVLGGIGGPAGLMIIDRLGFSPHGIVRPSDARIAVEVACFAIPATMTCIGVAFIWNIPICSRRAAVIRNRIERRAGLSLADDSVG